MVEDGEGTPRRVHPEFQAWIEQQGRSTPQPGDFEAWVEAGQTKTSEQLRQAVAREREFATPIQYERGMYLDHMAVIDMFLGNLIAAHFGIASDRAQGFDDLLIGGLTFSRRAEIIGRIVQARGLEERFGRLARGLKEANRVRNVLAHAHLSAGEAGAIFMGFRQRRGAMPADRWSLADLEAHRRRLQAINWRLSQLSEVMNESPSLFGEGEPFADVDV